MHGVNGIRQFGIDRLLKATCGGAGGGGGGGDGAISMPYKDGECVPLTRYVWVNMVPCRLLTHFHIMRVTQR